MADEGSGPAVARAFQKALALVFIVAWVSLGVQVHELIGSHGLLPFEPVATSLEARDMPFGDVPTLLRYAPSDAALGGGIVIGVTLGLAALAGFFSRAAFALSTLLYLSYAVACRNFLAFQWDNLLLECGALAAFLPADRRAAWAHFLFRVVLFKLYFESGLAKWQSHLADWQDGSAMAYYYETAPLPTWLGWYAHHLPSWWHEIESRGTLAFELAVPFLMFSPVQARACRLTAAAVLTGFQAVNIATANYGFFSYLAVCLHLFLLEDRDIRRVSAWLGRVFARARRAIGSRARIVQARVRLLRRRLHRVRQRLAWEPKTDDHVTLQFIGRLSVAAVVSTAYVTFSVHDGIRHFWPKGPEIESLTALRPLYAPYRIVNNYHLFGHITRERIEPEFQVFDGSRWTSFDLRYKPGTPDRGPPFVAPHQPRVDFLLWFYGLAHQGRVPPYVASLLERLCREPGAVQALFVSTLPERPVAARVAFYQYHFTTPEERLKTGAWWTRNEVGTPRAMRC